MIISEKINHLPAKQQFTLDLGEKKALISYAKRNGKYFLEHSEVPFELRGQGVGNMLLEKTFEYIENHGIEAIAVCSFIKAKVQRSSRWRSVIG